jgi:hypothetical protein
MDSEPGARQARLARLTISEGRWVYEIYDAAGELLEEVHTSPRGDVAAAKAWVEHSLANKYQNFPAVPIGQWSTDGATWQTDLQPRARHARDHRG